MWTELLLRSCKYKFNSICLILVTLLLLKNAHISHILLIMSTMNLCKIKAVLLNNYQDSTKPNVSPNKHILLINI